MSERDDGGPAFPSSYATPSGPVPYDDHHGMSLRDHFAGLAMQAIFDGGRRGWEHDELLDDRSNWSDVVADSAYTMADAMLERRKVK